MSFVEDHDGLPWTARIGPVWMTLFVLVTLGLGPILLALYLGVWAGRRYRTWLPLTYFVIFTGIAAFSWTVVVHPVLSGILDAFVLFSPVFWVWGHFLLRNEMQKDARSRGLEPDISPLLTFILASLYLNHCLSPSSFKAQQPALATATASLPS